MREAGDPIYQELFTAVRALGVDENQARQFADAEAAWIRSEYVPMRSQIQALGFLAALAQTGAAVVNEDAYKRAIDARKEFVIQFGDSSITMTWPQAK
jgi:hypothetical protein